MKAGNIKGALLEYIVRNVLKNCGFKNIRPDNLFSYQRGGLLYINGRGAAHDADIIMNPPVQMPFTYPTQLIFECKAYAGVAGLNFVRGAIGLRHDLNEFEVVTRDTLLERQNNRRASYAIDTRTRFLYQVGVAAVNDFTKPAVECAANNKVPLLSLSWFLGVNTIRDINRIDQPMVNSFAAEDIKNLYDFLKDRDGLLQSEQYSRTYDLLRGDNIFGGIVTFANTVNRFAYVGLLETGDMVFLFPNAPTEDNILNREGGFRSYASLRAEIHWNSNRPNVWRLTVYEANNRQAVTDFDFYVPNRLFSYWESFSLDRGVALDMKERFFSKIFVFNQRNNPEAPFSIINIDNEWLRAARETLEREGEF